MKEVFINEPSELIKIIYELPNSFVFRGQSNANWKLESALERILVNSWDKESIRKFEDYSLDLFKSKFHLYDLENQRPESKFGWLSIMQHYGVPTRLIDFTQSPLIALFFALESYDFKSKPNFSLYAFNFSKLMDSSTSYLMEKNIDFSINRHETTKNDFIFEKYIDCNDYEILWVSEPNIHNTRIERQSGCFLISGCDVTKISTLAENSLYVSSCWTKYNIESKLWETAYSLIRKSNISAKTLYGDLSGLAGSIKLELSIYGSTK